eukprot:SAG22_NODE_317_length_12513_cov_41.467214_10_plen_266_part_00
MTAYTLKWALPLPGLVDRAGRWLEMPSFVPMFAWTVYDSPLLMQVRECCSCMPPLLLRSLRFAYSCRTLVAMMQELLGRTEILADLCTALLTKGAEMFRVYTVELVTAFTAISGATVEALAVGLLERGGLQVVHRLLAVPAARTEHTLGLGEPACLPAYLPAALVVRFAIFRRLCLVGPLLWTTALHCTFVSVSAGSSLLKAVITAFPSVSLPFLAVPLRLLNQLLGWVEHLLHACIGRCLPTDSRPVPAELRGQPATPAAAAHA